MAEKYFIFTDCDLDGAGSYIMFPWFTGKFPDRMALRVNDFESKYKHWVSQGNLNKYDRVFILDLDISRVDCIELVDNEKVTIIDHHQTHVDNKHVYKHAKTHIEKYPSCTKMVYNMFKKGGKDLSTEQKMIVAMVDDYDSYTLKIPQSYHLNLLFWNYQGDRVEKFINEFGSGYKEFTDEQKTIINFYQKKLENIKKDLSVHWAEIPIGDKTYKFISVFADECINEVADHIIKNYKADVGVVVNLKSNKVSLRRSKKCELSLGNLAEKLFDQGGGHDEAAGGVLCETFLKFSSIFKQMGIKIGK
jgi:oligoribonuclease NrnB/cAMP/cGMP phosphodiesterase (DHH superfamily)